MQIRMLVLQTNSLMHLHHYVAEGLPCDGGRVELPVMQLGVAPRNIGEMMDTVTTVPSQQCMISYSTNQVLATCV